MTTAAIIDTETTGLKHNEVIELAILPYTETPTGLHSNKHLAMCYRFKPATPMQYGAMAVHHILPEMLEDESPSCTAPSLVPAVDYLIGHNIDYDCKALGLMQGKRIDTLPMARVLWPECDSHSQTALMYYLEGATLETRAALRGAHSALADVGFCSTILEHIIAGLGVRTLAALYEASELARIPSSMSFGKFKGEPISNVDRGWASWYAKQADTDRYLIIALRNAGKL